VTANKRDKTDKHTRLNGKLFEKVLTGKEKQLGLILGEGRGVCAQWTSGWGRKPTCGELPRVHGGTCTKLKGDPKVGTMPSRPRRGAFLAKDPPNGEGVNKNSRTVVEQIGKRRGGGHEGAESPQMLWRQDDYKEKTEELGP